jgi:hypothetical protein
MRSSSSGATSPADVFLLSPAHSGGRRAAMLLEPRSHFAAAAALAAGTLTLGEAFSFMSGLYFRGKLAYASAFGHALVITPTRGLVPADAIVSRELLREFSGIDIKVDDPRFRVPMQKTALALEHALPADARVVLLGSVATPKYVDILAEIFGRRLHFPPAFIGRGDMSRGGLMLRSARAGVPLDYAPLDPATRRTGARPPKLAKLTRSARPAVVVHWKRMRKKT